jgi:hypothetical protein
MPFTLVAALNAARRRSRLTLSDAPATASRSLAEATGRLDAIAAVCREELEKDATSR